MSGMRLRALNHVINKMLTVCFARLHAAMQGREEEGCKLKIVLAMFYVESAPVRLSSRLVEFCIFGSLDWLSICSSLVH